MIRVSLTGNIGSGKSTIAKVFECLNVPVFYSDPAARSLYRNESILAKIVDKFGSDILTIDGELNKQALASIIFSDKQSLLYVNSIIHPAVAGLFKTWSAEMESQGSMYCISEAALTYESGSYKMFDKVIVVHAPEEILLQRIEKRDRISRQQALQRLDNQMPQKDKIARADYLILNDNQTMVLPQVLAIHNHINSLALNMG